MPISLRPLRADDLPELEVWYADAELARRLSPPTAAWHAAVIRQGQEVWGVEEAGRLVATVQVEREGDWGHVALAVRPALRGCGLGRAALAAFQAGPGSDYAALLGWIEPDNVASLTCARRYGFQVSGGPDAEGLLPVRWDNPAWRSCAPS